MSKLSVKHAKFIEGVLSGMTLISAYREAGYKAKTDSAACTSASQIFRNLNVQAEFKRRMDEQESIDKLRLDRIRSEALVEVHKLIKSATNDDRTKVDMIKDVLDRSGMKPQELVEHTGEIRIVKEIVTTTGDDNISGEPESRQLPEHDSEAE